MIRLLCSWTETKADLKTWTKGKLITHLIIFLYLQKTRVLSISANPYLNHIVCIISSWHFTLMCMIPCDLPPFTVMLQFFTSFVCFSVGSSLSSVKVTFAFKRHNTVKILNTEGSPQLRNDCCGTLYIRCCQTIARCSLLLLLYNIISQEKVFRENFAFYFVVNIIKAGNLTKAPAAIKINKCKWGKKYKSCAQIQIVCQKPYCVTLLSDDCMNVVFIPMQHFHNRV